MTALKDFISNAIGCQTDFNKLHASITKLAFIPIAAARPCCFRNCNRGTSNSSWRFKAKGMKMAARDVFQNVLLEVLSKSIACL